MYDLFDDGPQNELEPFASIMAHDHASEWSSVDPAGFTGLLPPQAGPSRLDEFETFESAAEIMRTAVYSPAFPLIAPDDFLLSSSDAAKPGPTYGALATHSDDGVTEVEEVVITAQPGMSRDDINRFMDDLYGGNGVDPDVPPTGGGGDQSTEDRPHDPCEDRQADTLADQIKDEIMAKGDSDRVEYHSLIWRDDQGNLHMTEPLPLTDTFPADPAALGLDSYSQVVGLVHSHPSEVNLNGEWVDATHGWVHGGDWVNARWWVNNHELDENNFSLYIVYEGEVREYDWADNKNRDVFDDDRDEDAQESGDYNPGASCP